MFAKIKYSAWCLYKVEMISELVYLPSNKLCEVLCSHVYIGFTLRLKKLHVFHVFTEAHSEIQFEIQALSK